jgi:hypothetical protein
VEARLFCFGLGSTAPVAITPQSGRIAFVTTQPLTVDFGGLTTADNLCSSEAALARLPGTYLAALATTTAAWSSRFDLSGANWVRLDGVPLAASTLALAQGTLDVPLNVASSGAYIGGAPVLSGSMAPTQLGATGFTCGDWTNALGAALYGVADTATDVFYSVGGTTSCNAPIYCFQR